MLKVKNNKKSIMKYKIIKWNNKIVQILQIEIADWNILNLKLKWVKKDNKARFK